MPSREKRTQLNLVYQVTTNQLSQLIEIYNIINKEQIIIRFDGDSRFITLGNNDGSRLTDASIKFFCAFMTECGLYPSYEGTVTSATFDFTLIRPERDLEKLESKVTEYCKEHAYDIAKNRRILGISGNELKKQETLAAVWDQISHEDILPAKNDIPKIAAIWNALAIPAEKAEPHQVTHADIKDFTERKIKELLDHEVKDNVPDLTKAEQELVKTIRVAVPRELGKA